MGAEDLNPKIQHNPSALGPTAAAEGDPSDMPVAEAEGPQGLSKKITAFGQESRHEDEWTRSPNTTGTGAIHVRTFHSKMTDDALTYLDRPVNEWLDAHPQYEVKFVSTTIGTFTGKVKEPHLVCQIWV